MKEILPRIDRLIRDRKRPWTRTGPRIRVELAKSGRIHDVHVSRVDDRYVFRATILPASEVKESPDRWRRLAYRAWRRNASKELVTFAFDEQDRLIGLIDVVAGTLDPDELERYIESVAKECDRFEYALVGDDHVE